MTKLEFLRRNMGISQRTLAKAIGVSPSILSHIERGRRETYPKLRKALAEYFGLPESELFASDGWPLEVDLEVRKLG
ncbi:MAG: helix-turn-helix transcriptional regulator [Kyrpidia sp.]|nr:helix-turn-helix transcriptional regulator [Kyrpidia sp.]